MTFGIVTVNCGRPLVLRLWLASIDRLREHVGFCFPAVVVSDAIDETICKVHNVAHITKPNRPVSDKWNAGFMHMRDLEVDYVIILGSDDIMSNDYLDRAIEESDKDVM